jgi:hypothetical protein
MQASNATMVIFIGKIASKGPAKAFDNIAAVHLSTPVEPGPIHS